MSSEMNIYAVGPNSFESYDHNGMSYLEDHGDFVFRKSTSKNMDKLCAYFHKNDRYPEFYLGIAKKIAICKCPIDGKEEWFNGDRNLKINNPEKGSTVTVYLQIMNNMYKRDFIFMGWVNVPVHEWKTSKGTIMMLEQKFIDGLLPEDKRYLKMNY